MKYFALFSICFYFITVYVLKKEPTEIKESKVDQKTIKKVLPQTVLSTPLKKVKKIKKVVPPIVKTDFLKKVVKTFPKTMKTTLTPIDEVNLYRNGKKIKALKLLVSHQRKDGQKSSYHALVHQKTGQVLKTFNRPHREPSEDFGLRYKGKI